MLPLLSCDPTRHLIFIFVTQVVSQGQLFDRCSPPFVKLAVAIVAIHRRAAAAAAAAAASTTIRSDENLVSIFQFSSSSSSSQISFSAMKGIKGRILKQLNSISPVPYLKHHDEALCPPPCPRSVLGDLLVGESVDLIRNLEEDDEGSDLVGSSPSSCDKENYRPQPQPPPKGDAFMGFDEKRDGGERYRRPDPESETLFDPDLLAAFREAVMEYMRGFEEYKRRSRARADALIERNREGDPPEVGEAEPPTKLPRTDDSSSGAVLNPLLEFEYRCPPGGEESVILYTTTLRGIRKTFEDCKGVRFLLQSLKIQFFERDVSMHLAFRKELWGALEGRAIPPRLFILGRYIGGADEVLGLHERGRLLPLLKRVPTDQSAMDGAAGACEGCAGVKFVVCWECNGSRKVHGEEELGATQCQHCNENGLVLCPICC